MKNYYVFTFLFFLIPTLIFAQAEKEYVYNTFAGKRIVNSQSVEMHKKGMMQFIISHRFGQLNTGKENWFGFRDVLGLDDATIRLGLEYGALDWLNFGIGRSSNEKVFDGFVKARILRQYKGEKKMPISVVWYSSIAYRTQLFPPIYDFDNNLKKNLTYRLFYANQLIIGSKVHERLSLQIMPTHVHRNLVNVETEANDIFALGFAARVQVLKHLGISLEYFWLPNGQNAYLPTEIGPNGNPLNLFPARDALSLNFDIETNGHVFQIQLTNSRGITEKFYIGETGGQWGNGDIRLGFNIVRDFRIHK